MGRYDVLIKCAQVRKLIEESKYTKALEELNDFDLTKVHSMSDLKLFAKVYEKADEFEKARNIYSIIYQKKHSKRALYQLVLMELRTGELKEAKELYEEYELAAGITLDTYELRYRLAKAEGVSRKKLIELLEDLRKEEFTEEWGYQLAKLYELEGDRKKCIEICEELILWFGSGAIIDKARELRNEVSEPDWQPPKDMEIPEPMKAEKEEVEMIFATPPVEMFDLQKEEKKDSQEEEKTVSEEEVKNEESVEQEETMQETQEAEDDSAQKEEEKESEPVEEKKEPEQVPEEPEESMPEENILISPNNIFYFTLKDIIRQVHSNKKGIVHFAIAGGEDRISLAIAKKLIKELNNINYFKANSIAKIHGHKLNDVDLDERIKQVVGGCMLILGAQDMNEETVRSVEAAIERYKNDIVFVLTGEFDELDCWFAQYRELEHQVCYKVKL